jgi:GTPase SAR1 family protein
MENAIHSTAPCALRISGISIDFSDSEKNIESAEARIGKLSRPIAQDVGKTMRQAFSPPIKLSLGDTFSLHLRYRRRFRKIGHEEIHFDLADMLRTSDAGQEYRKSHDNFKIVVILSGNTITDHAEQSASTSDTTLELQSTTSEIIQICPRFRILVIGKTGVGKSSLINRAFGVHEAIASVHKPGEADIDHEFFSPQNDRFVLHDSKGFEPGEEGNVNTVRDFIERRRKMPDLKDQLHAVWLCFEIPRAGGRLLETGTEDFLTLKRGGKLGNIPVVVVFTKYDRFINRVNRTLDESSLVGLSSSAVKEFIKNKADAELKEICIGPLEKFAGLDVPYATVSTKEEHAETLARLIQITEDRVCKHVATEASVMTSIAQRVDPGLKFKASIDVGKRRYWKALASCASFQDRTMWDCLRVLHTDLVAVWNFHDPHGYLYSNDFRNLIVNLVDKLDLGPPTNPNKTMAVGLSTVGAIAGIVSVLAGPAAPIVVPIVASVVIAKWAYDVYQLSGMVLQRFIAYIVDLTLVLQTLYLVSDSKELSRRTIKLAVASYHASPTSGEVHNRIQGYDRKLTLLERADRDTLDRIIELMESYRMDAKEISAARAQIPTVDLAPDEPW